MSDKEHRRLEREAREGDHEAARRFLRERVRLGLDPEPWWTPTASQVECSLATVQPVAVVGRVTGIRYVLIPPGTFTMGSPESEEGRWDDETPHSVTLTEPFYLAATPVTNGVYRKFRPDHRSGHYQGEPLEGNDQPVVRVSWRDSEAFGAWLAEQDGFEGTRLPTEAEWG